MSWLNMPPLSALRAFSAFAEMRSVVRAGDSLNVSHAAISQQMRALETHMNVALLDRSGRALRLTPEGEQLARALDLGFGAIKTAVQELSGAGADRPLHVTCTPTFAARWLMPRLADFRARHPGIDLVLDPTGELTDPGVGRIDLAIRFGAGRWPGLQAEMLLQSAMVVIAAPGLLDGRTVSSPADLLTFPWLEELGTTEASLWLESRGVPSALKAGKLELPGNLLMEAVRDGQGIAVSVRHFVEADIRAGRLVELFSDDDGRGYHIVTRPDTLRPAARRFISWLRQQADLPTEHP